MTCNITATPLEVEPLPLYQRDPDTSSLLSSAPSYTSEAPTYRSSARDSQLIPEAHHQQQPQPYYISTSLLDISAPPPSLRTANPPSPPPPDRRLAPSTAYAPGFTSRAPNAAPDAEALQNNYNIGAWSSVTSSHARRQYERVAMRRASRAAGVDRTSALLESMRLGGDGEQPPSPVECSSRAGTPPPGPPAAVVRSDTHEVVGAGEDAGRSLLGERGVAADAATAAPVLPHEDPALVGEAAAARARQQRLYREACLRHDDSVRLVQESKTWDFMLSQMADWEERERSWGRFRADVEVRQGRIGAMGVGVGRLGGFAIGDGGRGGSRKWSLGRGKFGGR